MRLARKRVENEHSGKYRAKCQANNMGCSSLVHQTTVPNSLLLRCNGDHTQQDKSSHARPKDCGAPVDVMPADR